MNARQIISIILIFLGGLLAFMPMSGKYAFHGRPERLLAESIDSSNSYSPDQVARFVVAEDSTIQLIDLRSSAEYIQFNIPGSINIPYSQFLSKDPEPYLNQPGKKNIFYSNGDLNSNYALVLARGLGYKNCFVMKGGLNGWYAMVMTSSFPEGKISGRENALYETRLRARNLFTQVNSMPDSLKIKFIASKRFDPKKLDGGCQ